MEYSQQYFMTLNSYQCFMHLFLITWSPKTWTDHTHRKHSKVNSKDNITIVAVRTVKDVWVMLFCSPQRFFYKVKGQRFIWTMFLSDGIFVAINVMFISGLVSQQPLYGPQEDQKTCWAQEHIYSLWFQGGQPALLQKETLTTTELGWAQGRNKDRLCQGAQGRSPPCGPCLGLVGCQLWKKSPRAHAAFQ